MARNQFSAASAPSRLQAVETPVSILDLLDCKDRSIGHDWAHDIAWEDGPDEVVGRGRSRKTIYLVFRYCRCFRCGSLRRELFIQDDSAGSMEKLPNKTRYTYSAVWHDYEKLTQGQLRYRLRKERLAREAAAKGE